MPLTLELSKPRLCRDERYINLFVSDLPFKLDTLRDVPHCINKTDKIITTDDKSGYDHILLSDNSKKYFGLVFDGWVMCYCSLPFGFKASCYIYHSISQVVQAIYAVGGCLAGANGVSAGSSLARLRHRWWKVRSFLCGKFSSGDGTA